MPKVGAQAVSRLSMSSAKGVFISTLSTDMFVRFLTRIKLSGFSTHVVRGLCQVFYKSFVRFLTGWVGRLSTVSPVPINIITNKGTY